MEESYTGLGVPMFEITCADGLPTARSGIRKRGRCCDGRTWCSAIRCMNSLSSRSLAPGAGGDALRRIYALRSRYQILPTRILYVILSNAQRIGTAWGMDEFPYRCILYRLCRSICWVNTCMTKAGFVKIPPKCCGHSHKAQDRMQEYAPEKPI